MVGKKSAAAAAFKSTSTSSSSRFPGQKKRDRRLNVSKYKKILIFLLIYRTRYIEINFSQRDLSDI